MVIASNLLEVVALAMAASVSGAALAVLGLVAKRLSGGTTTGLPLLSGSRELTTDLVQPVAASVEVPAVIRRLDDSDELLDRFYVDLPSLEALAGDLGIPVDAVRIEESISSAESANIEAQLSAALEVPGVGSVKAGTGGAASRIDAAGHSVSVERRVTLRELLSAVCHALHARGRLNVKTMDFPDASSDLLIASSMFSAKLSWRLPEPTARPAARDGDTALASLELSDEEKLASAAELILQEAIRKIRDVKVVELRLLGQDTKAYVLVEAEWLAWVRPDTDAYEFWGNRLENVSDIPTYPGWIRPAGFLVKMTFENSHLTARGRAQFGEQRRVRATVLAKVLRFEDEPGVLVVTPLAVFS